MLLDLSETCYLLVFKNLNVKNINLNYCPYFNTQQEGIAKKHFFVLHRITDSKVQGILTASYGFLINPKDNTVL